MSQVVRNASSPAEPEVPGPTTGAAGSRYIVGEIIADKYELCERLDEGGMGSLWIAKNQALDAQVVLKLIRTDVATPGAEERFLTEARAAARLKHPGIVRVFDFGRTRHSEPFIVMELLHGENLGDVLDREGRFSAIQALQVLLPIVDGLVAAHSRGVVHRDLKPDNVFLSDTDGRLQPKLLDFGIARLGNTPLGDHRITQAGTVVGSPDYMAPEQARGLDDIDHRADIWALCVMIYECITGRVPFEDKNYNSLLRHIIEDPIPSILDFAAGDEELWNILQKGFEKDRDKRYQSMRELGEAMASWLLARGINEDICGQSLRAAWLDSGLGTGRASLVSFTGLRALTPSTMPPPVAPSTAPPPAVAAPPSITVVAEPPPPIPRSGRRRLVAVAVLALLMGAGFVVVSAWTRGDKPKTATAPVSESVRFAPVPAPPPPATPSPTEAVATPPEPARTGEKKSRAPAKATGAASPAKSSDAKPSPPPSTPSKPKGGYAEDLGF